MIADALPSFTVLRHCVAKAGNGLSPLQNLILDHPARIRILSAPTGAGKSYAFQRAVADRRQRVLFIVPTRRLAQNLAASMIEALVADGVEADADAAARRVILWTSDRRQELREADPTLNIGHLRVRELRGYPTLDDGAMIIATPESIGWMLLKPGGHAAGQSPAALVDLLRFDHLVFDEFHTISARGLGLAAAIAKVAAEVGEGGAKITFLSATPIDILTPLLAFGVPKDQILVEAESIVTGEADETRGMRAVHGDVAFQFQQSENMLDLLQAHDGAARACLERGRQLVVVYNSLEALHRDKRALARWCDDVGVSAAERLAINSADDAEDRRLEGDFTIGRRCDPMDFKILVATSSVEMGVTFKAGMMVMDPGHDAASFVQRAGRVARGDEPGNVVVRIDKRSLDRKPWLRTLLQSLPNSGENITVEAFQHSALQAARRRFEPQENLDDTPPETAYASMPLRAVWCAALFWASLETSKHLYLGGRRSLSEFTPDKAKLVLAKLAELHRCDLEAARRWRDAFRDEALVFRDIQENVEIREPSGACRRLPRRLYESYATLLNAPSTLETTRSGVEILVVHADRSIGEIFEQDDKRRPEGQIVQALFPHVGPSRSLHQERLAEAWLQEAEGELRNPRLRRCQEKALAAAKTLVSLSGVVPTERTIAGADQQTATVL